jgi:hypothetical protein
LAAALSAEPAGCFAPAPSRAIATAPLGVRHPFASANSAVYAQKAPPTPARAKLRIRSGAALLERGDFTGRRKCGKGFGFERNSPDGWHPQNRILSRPSVSYENRVLTARNIRGWWVEPLPLGMPEIALDGWLPFSVCILCCLLHIQTYARPPIGMGLRPEHVLSGWGCAGQSSPDRRETFGRPLRVEASRRRPRRFVSGLFGLCFRS